MPKLKTKRKLPLPCMVLGHRTPLKGEYTCDECNVNVATCRDCGTIAAHAEHCRDYEEWYIDPLDEKR